VVVGFHNSYAFLENNLVYAMLNHLRKKRVRVYAMPLGWQPLGIHNMIGSLAYCSINLTQLVVDIITLHFYFPFHLFLFLFTISIL
jgi:hypothetical protein